MGKDEGAARLKEITDYMSILTRDTIRSALHSGHLFG